MPYTIKATSDTPFLLIYLIDVSGSMEMRDCGGMRRIDVVQNALKRSMRRMIALSRTGDIVRPRYAVGMVAYNNSTVKLTQGIKYIDQLETFTVPDLIPSGNTNTASAFQEAYEMMNQFIGGIQDCPAPMVCHLTDGLANRGDRSVSICEQIKALSTADGNVLVENIFIGPQLLKQPIVDPKSWPGVLNPNEIKDEDVQSLWHQSSPLPSSYAEEMNEAEGYGIQPGVRMLIPAEVPEMIELAFAMSTSTPRGK